MKDIIVISALSFILISMGTLYSMGYLRFGPEKIEITPPSTEEQESVSRIQLLAIETQLKDLERKRAEILSLQNDLELEKRIIADLRVELDSYLTRIEEVNGKVDQKYLEKISKLAKLYDSMKPEDAAPIATSLKMDLLVDIISNMKDKKAAKLMATLPPHLSAEVSRRLGKKPTA